MTRTHTRNTHACKRVRPPPAALFLRLPRQACVVVHPAGHAAEEAGNVFYYLTYEGTVDLDAIEDPALVGGGGGWLAGVAGWGGLADGALGQQPGIAEGGHEG